VKKAKTSEKTDSHEKNLENDPEHIKKLWKTYNFQLMSSTSRRERLEDLLTRGSALELSIEKRDRFQKRLTIACKEQEEAVLLVEQLKFLLERLNLHA
jgi:hypothetical protein